MGQNSCCLRPPRRRTREPSPAANDQHAAIINVGRIPTLGEMIANSPIVDSHSWSCQNNVQRTETMRRVLYQTSPDFNNVFYTPRISFSSGKLEKIEELSGDEEEAKQACRISPKSRSQREKVKKKVRFMLPDEAPADHVVILYSPIPSGVICSK